jgi:hypothetical protein
MKMPFLLLLLTGCSIISFGNKAPPSAKDVRYQVKFRLAEWSAVEEKRSDYVFENKEDGRILLSNSFCEEFQEQSLEDLAAKTFRAVDGYKKGKGSYTTFHNREAFRSEGSGVVDGVKVYLQMLNTRRNNCYFDFVSITPENASRAEDQAFQHFLDTVEFK